MKTILVDAVNAFVDKNGVIDDEMHCLLEEYPNPKIILTGADDENFKRFGLDRMPYPVFTLKHDPEKTDPKYYRIMLEHSGLMARETVYFEHDQEAVASAQSVGITSLYYDETKRDMTELKNFLDNNL